jgi:pathogenesis-related protein 1
MSLFAIVLTLFAAPPKPLLPLLDAHNELRAQHCAAPLTWSAEVAKSAQKWADDLAARDCAFEHSKTSYGENLAAGTEGALLPDGAVRMWYDEIKKYDFAKGKFSMATGHFTQVVWQGSRSLGCGISKCKGMQIFVCQYDPPGNVQGEFVANVKKAGRCKK